MNGNGEITFKGQPLSDAVEAMESREKGAEIARERKADMKQRDKLMYYKPKNRMEEETRRVSRRVIHLSDEQIRKDYGLAMKPYKTVAENIIATIRKGGPITAKNINHVLGLIPRQTSSTISYIYQALSPNYMVRRLLGKEYEYKFIKEISVEIAHKLYKKYINLKGSSVKKVDDVKSDKDIVQHKAKDVVKGFIEEVVSKELGIKVQVEGEIKILFGFTK
jgi:hypothetical protein